MPQLFISHAEEDQAIAVEIATELEQRGFGVWHYKRDTTAGLTYVQQVMEAVKKCACVILIVSKSSMDSHEVDTEVINAYRAKKRFVPVLCGVSHEEFSEQKPEWSWVTGAAVSIALPTEGVPGIVDALETGVRGLGIKPAPKPVACSMYAPGECVAGVPYPVQVWLHDPVESGKVGRMAEEFDGDARRTSGLVMDALPRGTPLQFKLEAADLPVESWDTVERIWEGRADAVNFLVNAPEDGRRSKVVGVVHVYREQVPVGLLRFMLKIKGEEQSKAEPSVTPTQHKNAYLCYSGKDRAEVLMRAQVLSGAGINFMDSLDIQPGADWRTQASRMIDQADIFFLFWSEAAARSEEVMREVHYALSRQQNSRDNLPRIIPVILSTPAPPPPKELAHIHFNDRVNYLIEAEKALKKKSSGEE